MSKSTVSSDIQGLKSAYEQLKKNVDSILEDNKVIRRDLQEKGNWLLEIEDTMAEAQKRVELAVKQLEISGKRLEDAEKTLLDTSKKLEKKVNDVEYWKDLAERRLARLEAWESRFRSLEAWRDSHLDSTVSASDKANADKDTSGGKTSRKKQGTAYATAYVCDERTDPPTMVLDLYTENEVGPERDFEVGRNGKTGLDISEEEEDSEESETPEIHEHDSVEHVKYRRTHDWVKEAIPGVTHDDNSMDVSLADEVVSTKDHTTRSRSRKGKKATEKKSSSKRGQKEMEEPQTRCKECRKNTRKYCEKCRKPVCLDHCVRLIRCPDYDPFVDDCFHSKDGTHVSKDNISTKPIGRCGVCPTNSRRTARTKCQNCKRYICLEHQKKNIMCREHEHCAPILQDAGSPVRRIREHSPAHSSIESESPSRVAEDPFCLDTDYSYILP